MNYFYYSSKKLTSTTMSYVPSQNSCFNLSFKTLILLMIIIAPSNNIECKRDDGGMYRDKYHLPETSSNSVEPTPYTSELHTSESKFDNEPTPPLNDRIFRRELNEKQRDSGKSSSHRRLISPQKVSEFHNVLYMSDANLHTPIFNLRSAVEVGDNHARALNAPLLFGDTSDLMEVLEPGSGSGWPDSITPEEAPKHEEFASANNDYAPSSSNFALDQLMTPVFGQPVDPDKYDQPPVLARRLPKLIATAGLSWHYTIPSDTFIDEDGDLRQLKSSLIIEQSDFPNRQNDTKSRALEERYMHWLQYDHNTQTLYGFPVLKDVGDHTYTLLVLDHLGSSNNETIEITVRPHQSSRAFTHLITLKGIEWNSMKYSSIVDALEDIVKRIGVGVYPEKSAKKMIVHSYSLSEPISSSTTNGTKGAPSLLILSWSNSSISVNNCDIEEIFRVLVDERYLVPGSEQNLKPSHALLKALSPDIVASSVGFELKGACADGNKISSSPRTQPNAIKVRTRIGKLKWKLGQPIIYKIPDDVFIIGSNSSSNQSISLTLHTIDGVELAQDPKFGFLDFVHETRTIYGLPYDVTRHAGQRELLLTARAQDDDQGVARETFIFDIEPQDLTTINNRAFRMSLYFMTRTSVFGPREQVELSRRMITALEITDPSFDHDQESQEFTVISIQKYRTGMMMDNSASLSDPANSWIYQNKIQSLDDTQLDNAQGSSLVGGQTTNEGSVFYKLTWTNETIGYRGDCPVEVIRDNILYALERSMVDYVPPQINNRAEDPNTNDSVRFYERLRSYFEPELDLIHLRFEPLSACVDALELHDVGNSEIADMADRATEVSPAVEQGSMPMLVKIREEPKMKEVPSINSDEYWAIVVLIILVVAIIFVVMMLFMGLHTYRINQEKRFELQMKLAQARQNSMYLSSLVLAEQLHPADIVSQQALGPSGTAKSIYLEERSSRKPVILDNEKQLVSNGHIMVPVHKPTTVQLMGQTIQTTPLKPNMTFTVDSIADLQNANLLSSIGPETMMANQFYIGNQQRSMTLNRRPTNLQNQQTQMTRKASMSYLSQSQSILTVASLGSSIPIATQSQTGIPFVYAPLPTFYEAGLEVQRK